MKTYVDSIQMMLDTGGSFARSLAACYYTADLQNKRRLLEAFSDYFGAYERQWRAMQPKQTEAA